MRYRLTQVLWLLSDYLLFLGCYAVAYYIRIGQFVWTDYPFEKHIVAAAIAGPVWVGLLILMRNYGLTRSQTSLRNICYMAYASFVGTAVFSLSYYFLYQTYFSRLILVYAFALTAVLTWLWHVVFQRLQREILRSDPPFFPTLIVGVTRESTKMIQELNSRRNPLKPVAILDAAGCKEKEIDGVPVCGKLNKLEETIKYYKINHLIHCKHSEHAINLLSICERNNITYLGLPSVYGIINHDSRVESLEKRPVTVVRPKDSLLQWFFQ